MTILLGFNLYSQPSMTAKEGFYFVLKINKEKLTDNAIHNNDNQYLNLRWFDLYTNLFDKSNCKRNSEDEFKWPAYSKKITDEIYQGVESADFKKLYSINTSATFGKYDFEHNCFPIEQAWGIWAMTVASDDHINFKVDLNIGPLLNSSDFNFTLKMDPQNAEKLVQSNRSRNLDMIIVYNVVNKMMTNRNKWDEKYIGIYAHKIVLLNGPTILGEFFPNIDYYDKVNFIKIDPRSSEAQSQKPGYKDGANLASYGQLNDCDICGTYFNETSQGGECIKIEPNGFFKHYWNCEKPAPSNLGIWSINERSIVLYFPKKERLGQVYKDFQENVIKIEDYFTYEDKETKVEYGTTTTSQKYVKWAKKTFQMK